MRAITLNWKDAMLKQFVAGALVVAVMSSEARAQDAAATIAAVSKATGADG